MNNRQILASLNKIANTLDNNGLFEEAKSLTFVMKKVAQEMMPESAETYLEPNPELTDIKDAKIDERIFTFVNRAMADHNSYKDGWMTLRGLINKDPIINRDKQTYEFAKKKAEKLFNDKLDMIGGKKGTFRDDAGFLGSAGDKLPYRNRAPKPGGPYKNEKPIKNQFEDPFLRNKKY